MINETKRERNRRLLSIFLTDRQIDKQYQIDREKYGNPFGYIYCIENINTHMKYIGATYAKWVGTAKLDPITQIKKRASDYLYEYNTAIDKHLSAFRLVRPITQAMVNEGFENFIMYPIAETTRSNHKEAELYFISKFNTIKNGYNSKFDSSNINKCGHLISAAGKKSRSNEIIAINLNQKEIIFSDSAKLFGDYMNSSKDMIKNELRKGRPYKGWFIFYTEKSKRDSILIDRVINEYHIKPQDKHSEKSKKFYSDLCHTVDKFLSDENSNEYFPGFKILDSLRYE